MDKKPKANSVVSTELGKTEGGTDWATIKFKVKDAGEAVLTLANLHPKVRERAMLHGLVQKVSDAAALSRNTETGLSASPSEKLAAMARLVEHFNSGTEEWSTKREGGGGPSVETGLLVAALSEIYPGKTPEQLGKWVKARSAPERAALMAQENVKAIVERLRAESAKSVDTDALLAGLESLGDEPEGTGA